MSYRTIKELRDLISEGCSNIDDLRLNLTYGQKVSNSYHSDLFDMMKTEFFSIDSASILLESYRYKDCLSIIRTILEALLVFWLIVRAKKYRTPMWYTVKGSDKKSPEIIRNEIVEKWTREKNNGNPKYQHIKKITKLEQSDQFYVIYESEGLFNEEDKNKMHIPYLYFLINESYDPAAKLEGLESIKEGVIHQDPKRMKIQKDYYQLNFRFEALIENLIINDLVKENQADYLRVHYNFLSLYVHPTKESINPNYQKLSDPHTRGYSNEILEELILLYLCRLQYLFLKIIIDRMKEDNPNANVAELLNFCRKLDMSSNYFWFFDNEPTQYDIEVSNARKHLKKYVEKKEVSLQVLYYENPLDRLNAYRMTNNYQ